MDHFAEIVAKKISNTNSSTNINDVDDSEHTLENIIPQLHTSKEEQGQQEQGQQEGRS